MTLERLKWLVLTLVALLLVVCETARAIVHPGHPLPVEFLFNAGVLVTIAVFNEEIFRYITCLQLKQVQQFRELLALHDAALDITSESSSVCCFNAWSSVPWMSSGGIAVGSSLPMKRVTLRDP